MTVQSIETLQAESNTIRQFGNHVFALTDDLVSVYEVVSYENYEPKMIKELNKTYTVTSTMTWNDITDKFFGTPTAPNFNKTIKV